MRDIVQKQKWDTSWGFLPLKMLKWSAAVVHSIENAKTRYSRWVENAKIWYDYGMAGVLYCWKSKNKVGPELFFSKNTEIRYCLGFILLKILKQGIYSQGFNIYLKC